MGRAYQNRKDSMAKTSDAKARVYSKYAREIYVCAKSQMPKHAFIVSMLEKFMSAPNRAVSTPMAI